MANIEDLLRRREKILQEIDEQIAKSYTKPVALLFTDIVGSTEYFEKMGDIAGRQMIQTHNDLLFPIIESHGGKIIKTIGDSIMASFEDPREGVLCAAEMQRSLLDQGKSGGHRIEVRMGLHYGEALVDSRDLFGDMVNTSARVESMARGGEILISGELKRRVEDFEIPLVFLGSDRVKGKEEKVEFFIVNWDARDEKQLQNSWKDRTSPKEPFAKAKGVELKKKLDPEAELKEVKPLVAKGNPYLIRVMIPHPEMFYGRQAVIKRIMRRLSSESPQSVSIVGERRIGKSSLLNYLRSAEARITHLDEPENYFFLLIDFQQLRSIDPDRFVAVLFREFQKQFGHCIEVTLPENLEGLQFLCDRITSLGLRLIFLFDEFESVTKNERIGAGFYSYLRSLANNFAISFITASGKNLKDMCVTHEISDSPFFNIFSLLHLGLFRQEEGQQLIIEPSASRGLPLEPVSDKILQLGGLYPFFLQIACSSWFEYLEMEEKAAEDFQNSEIPLDVIELFREEAETHFEFVLENFSPEEKEVLKEALTKGASRSPQAQGLMRKGYLADRKDRLVPFSGEFGAFLSRYL